MASSLRQLAQTDAPKRAAVYLRVSTGRQAENDVSLPSQRDLTTRFCEGQGWSVVEEYVELGSLLLKPPPLRHLQYVHI